MHDANPRELPVYLYRTCPICAYLVLLLLTPMSFVQSGQLQSDIERICSSSLPGIQLPAGYTASVYCTGVDGADGLALSETGDIYAVSEGEGCIFRIDENGRKEIVADGFRNPEGIAVSRSGIVYIVEDIEEGRLIEITASGDIEVIIEGLSFPEGVAVSGEGEILITTSSLESGLFPPFLTEVSRVDSEGIQSVFSSLFFWSFSDIAVDSSGIVYVCNELSGYGFISASIIQIDPSDGSWNIFCEGLQACEGICFDADGAFPMYVVEEDTGEGSGRISIVDEDGSAAIFAEGFHNLEDIVVDRSGRIFASEDTSGNIILIQKDNHGFHNRELS